MGNTLDNPVTTKDTHNYMSSQGLPVGASGMQGWRLEMEDAHILVDIPSRPDHLFLAVFDGHAGAGAARYASMNFLKILESNKEWQDYLAGDCKEIRLLGEALGETFLAIDEHLRAHQQEDARDNSGCTSVTACITPTHIICANAGDSRCVLGTNNGTKPLSEDHKPYDDIEKRRIENAGGFVQWNRVDGDLAVSRALGDFSYKNHPNIHAKEQKITCWPDVTIHERDASDDLLILACDGLWDVFTSEDAIKHVRFLYSLGERNMGLIAEEMLDQSLDKGSKDNVSAVVVRLSGAKLGDESNGGVMELRKDRKKQRAQEILASFREGQNEDANNNRSL